MQPVNEKSLIHAIFIAMDKLDKGEYSESKAVAFSKLASQAWRGYEVEQRRALIQIKAAEMAAITGKQIEMRELSSRGFDDTTKMFPDNTDYENLGND